MPGKMPRSDPRPSVRVIRGAGSGQHLASVLQEGRENANIDAGLGFIWRISAEDARDRPRNGRAAPWQAAEYIVVTDDYSVADRLLAIIDPVGVKTFLAYSSIPVDQRGGIGSPRGKYKGWLGSLEPQAEDAGYLTARALIERGKRERAFGPDGKLHMLA